jgi:hypothetical protein
MPEIYECEYCYNRTLLDSHGCCGTCGSKAVISLHRLHAGLEHEMLQDLFTHNELESLFGLVFEKVGRA